MLNVVDIFGRCVGARGSDTGRLATAERTHLNTDGKLAGDGGGESSGAARLRLSGTANLGSHGLRHSVVTVATRAYRCGSVRMLPSRVGLISQER
ncbi:hypothetical protein Ate01nite_15510 [Actinoplanes teichomyceticus]|nr:hypothetical protein Ate01nite_15510 [Actinoplanes teichomyceticus]